MERMKMEIDAMNGIFVIFGDGGEILSQLIKNWCWIRENLELRFDSIDFGIYWLVFKFKFLG